MTYLLDVNALVALGFANHEFHNRIVTWLRSQPALALATCPITELGFIRVLAQVAVYGSTVAQAKEQLRSVKEAGIYPFKFLPDDRDLSILPVWVTSPKHITDGYLVGLAEANGAKLVTLDAKIPGAVLI
jgi:predicted nucleic acid-binding protein